jgi:hypothetical protein
MKSEAAWLHRQHRTSWRAPPEKRRSTSLRRSSRRATCSCFSLSNARRRHPRVILVLPPSHSMRSFRRERPDVCVSPPPVRVSSFLLSGDEGNEFLACSMDGGRERSARSLARCVCSAGREGRRRGGDTAEEVMKEEREERKENAASFRKDDDDTATATRRDGRCVMTSFCCDAMR